MLPLAPAPVLTRSLPPDLDRALTRSWLPDLDRALIHSSLLDLDRALTRFWLPDLDRVLTHSLYSNIGKVRVSQIAAGLSAAISFPPVRSLGSVGR